MHVILPNDIDDPAVPSGGNAYDRRVCDGLGALGWAVREHGVAGGWPEPSAGERAGLAAVLAGVPDGALVLLDGLVGSAVPDVLLPQAHRLRLVLLVHMPLGHDAERDALTGACAVITTSAATRARLLEEYGLPPQRVHVAAPGVDPAPQAPPSADGSRLLCVAAVTRHKGYDLVTEALAAVDLPYRFVWVGAFREPGLAPVHPRIRFAGPLVGADLAAAYADADLLVLASHAETYGMVVTEALARGIPVLATDVVAEALGHAPDGSRPGLLVPPGDPPALAAALRGWLGDADLRGRLRAAAGARRDTLTRWASTAERVSTVLKEVA